MADRLNTGMQQRDRTNRMEHSYDKFHVVQREKKYDSKYSKSGMHVGYKKDLRQNVILEIRGGGGDITKEPMYTGAEFNAADLKLKKVEQMEDVANATGRGGQKFGFRVPDAVVVSEEVKDASAKLVSAQDLGGRLDRGGSFQAGYRMQNQEEIKRGFRERDDARIKQDGFVSNDVRRAAWVSEKGGLSENDPTAIHSFTPTRMWLGGGKDKYAKAARALPVAV